MQFLESCIQKKCEKNRNKSYNCFFFYQLLLQLINIPNDYIVKDLTENTVNIYKHFSWLKNFVISDVILSKEIENEEKFKSNLYDSILIIMRREKSTVRNN